MKYALLILTLALTACNTRPVSPDGLNLITERQYQNVIDRYTDRQQKYSGLYNTMDVTATLVNSAVATAQVDQKARLLHWTREQYSQEISKAKANLGNETVVFVSFYTPDRKNDDLQKPTTQWRVYLEAEGQRWEPRIVRLRSPIADIQGLYSYHNRFATAYQMTFPIAATSIERGKSKFIITGPLGISTIDFAPVDPTLIRGL